MYNNTNPAELYRGTTWELIPSGKYIQSSNTALQTGGSNSVVISKANLPNIKLKVDTVSATIPEHSHTYNFRSDATEASISGTKYPGGGDQTAGWNITGYTNSAGRGNTGSISPSTEALGSGTALSIQPAYITLKFWKRLT